MSVRELCEFRLICWKELTQNSDGDTQHDSWNIVLVTVNATVLFSNHSKQRKKQQGWDKKPQKISLILI